MMNDTELEGIAKALKENLSQSQYETLAQDLHFYAMEELTDLEDSSDPTNKRKNSQIDTVFGLADEMEDLNEQAYQIEKARKRLSLAMVQRGY